ncbi:MAG: TraR/DksA C4-type zinc finger protein [Spirochaetales bacterium]|nr:TraR/DksA C4-type zinc finger protein [Calditrichota bacterium]MBN2657176.1 TraR/DksA C4-type zinc finger protein [Spirochaetales bacterium]
MNLKKGSSHISSYDKVPAKTSNTDQNSREPTEQNCHSLHKCILCGNPIPEEKMQPVPNTLLCISCQKK